MMDKLFERDNVGMSIGVDEKERSHTNVLDTDAQQKSRMGTVEDSSFASYSHKYSLVNSMNEN